MALRNETNNFVSTMLKTNKTHRKVLLPFIPVFNSFFYLNMSHFFVVELNTNLPFSKIYVSCASLDALTCVVS